MFLPIAAILALGIATLLGLAASKPGTFRIQRAATIDAPPEAIFPFLADFRRWEAWSPWEKLDPAMKKEFGGPESGVGASYAWSGNRKAGAGRMEITEAHSPDHLTIDLDFEKPWKAHNVTKFVLEPRGAGTAVTWSMSGPNLFMGKVMSVFMDMDNMIGQDFEKGLAALKAAAEAETTARV